MIKNITRFISLVLALYSSVSIAMYGSLVVKGNEDGTQWKLQESVDNAGFTSIVQNDKEFIAVGGKIDPYKAAIFNSNEFGKSWDTSYVHDKSPILNKVASSGNIIITVGEGAALLRSLDKGKTWQSVPLPSEFTQKNANIQGIGWNGKNFLIVGTYEGSFSIQQLVIAVSDEQGMQWHLSPSEEKLQQLGKIYTIYWDGRFWILGGTHKLIISRDGLGWSHTSIPLNDFEKIVGFIKLNNEWVVHTLDTDNTTNRKMFLLKSSDEGKTWTKIAAEFPFPTTINSISKIHWNNHIWVAVGKADRHPYARELGTYPIMLISQDGIHWKEAQLPGEVKAKIGDAEWTHFDDVLWDGTNWVAVGTYGRLDPTGCKSYTADYAGTLMTYDGSESLYISSLRLRGIVGEKGDYYIGGGEISFGSSAYGVGGSCKEEGGFAIIDINNNLSTLRIIAKKGMTSDEIQVLDSSIPTKKYRGILKRK